MIFDTIQYLDTYQSLSPNLKTAIHFLQHTDLSRLELGYFPIEHEKVTCTVVNRVLTDAPDFWESHDRHIDIHVVLSGAECIRCIPKDKTVICDEFRADSDSRIYHQSFDGAVFQVGSGSAIIIFPNEIHQTNCPSGGSMAVKKVVLKVATM